MISKWRLFLNFDREERWLASMAEQGFALVRRNCFGFYRFRSSEPKDTLIRIDYRPFRSEADFMDYVALFEDSGWKHIAGSRWSGMQYFQRINSGAGEEIFSDGVSKAGRYRRWSNFFFSLAAAWLPLMVVMLTSRYTDFRALLDPRLLYQTPGLWEKTAADFWSAFLFETPFALLRGIPLLIFPAAVVFALVSAVCAAVAYRRSMQ